MFKKEYKECNDEIKLNKTFLEQLQKQMIDNIEEEDKNTRQDKEVYLVPLEKKKSRMVGAMVSVAALLLFMVCIFLLKQPFTSNQKKGIGVVVPDQTDNTFVTDKPIPTEPVTATDKPIPTDPVTSTDKPIPTDPITATDKPVPTDPVTATDKPVVVLKELKNTTEMKALTKKLSKMQIGEEMPAVDYANDNLFVVHDYNYLLVFDTVKNKIVRAISLDFPEAKGNCEKLAVSVSIDLTRIYIQVVDSKKEGICYDAVTNTYLPWEEAKKEYNAIEFYDGVTYLRRIEYDGGIIGGDCGGNYTAQIDDITEASIVAMIPEYGKQATYGLWIFNNVTDKEVVYPLFGKQGVETMKEEKKGYEKLYKKGLYHNYSDDVSLKMYDFEVK